MSQIQLKRLTVGILIFGFGVAIIIYFTAGMEPQNPLGYDPLETKKYIHDLELYGGKANVLGEEFREWFVGLWYGRNLAYTIAVITVLTVLTLRFIATTLEEHNARQVAKHIRSPRPDPDDFDRF
jgi:hypothetical protein